MAIRHFPEMVQGSGEWAAARCGMLTASEMKLIITPTLKTADNDKSRAHLWELLAQRISGHVEPQYVSDDMLRGHVDEIEAAEIYSKHFAPATACGFIVNDRFGFPIGFSPDRLVGEHGLIECKSRRQKFQVQTIVENLGDDDGKTIPADYVIQVQTGLLVSERQWCDFISYSGGLPFAVVRVHPDPVIQEAIVNAAEAFEKRLAEKLAAYRALEADLIPTERRIEQEMFV